MGMNGVAIYRGKPVGSRIHVTGNSCSGKSTLAKQLAVEGVALGNELRTILAQPQGMEPGRFADLVDHYAAAQEAAAHACHDGRSGLEPYHVHPARVRGRDRRVREGSGLSGD